MADKTIYVITGLRTVIKYEYNKSDITGWFGILESLGFILEVIVINDILS